MEDDDDVIEVVYMDRGVQISKEAYEVVNEERRRIAHWLRGLDHAWSGPLSWYELTMRIEAGDYPK